MNLSERAEEIRRLLAEADRHAALDELSEAREHAACAVDLLDDQIADLMVGEST